MDLEPRGEPGRQAGRTVARAGADTAGDAQVRLAFAQAVQLLGGEIDILVNAQSEPARYAGPPRLDESTGALFHRGRDTRVTGCIRSAQRFLAVSQPDRATPVLLLEDL